MASEGWEFLGATQSALDALINDIDNWQMDDFEHVVGQLLPVRDDQVPNNEGGFVFKVSDETRVRRFLILGTNGGTYYVSQETLNKETITDLIRIINEGHGDLILREVYEIVTQNRCPKRDFAIYSVALCARYKTNDWHKMKKENNNKPFDEYLAKLQKTAFKLVPIVCRISTDLFMFIKHAEEISMEHQQKSGWGKCLLIWL